MRSTGDFTGGQHREHRNRGSRYVQTRFESAVAPSEGVHEHLRRAVLADRLADRVTESLQNNELRVQGLLLEVPESVLVDNAQANGERLAKLKDLSIHGVIDDFGMAYSSLSYLKNFPLTFGGRPLVR